MLARQDERELDALVARAFDEALARARAGEERFDLIQRFGKLNRQLAFHPVRAKIFLVLRKESHRPSFQDIASLVEKMGATRYRTARKRLVWVDRTPPEKDEVLLSPGDVARELGVSAKTVTNWCKKGLLDYVTLDSGHRRIPGQALATYRQSRAHWQAVDLAAARARGQEPAPSDEDVFAEFERQDREGAR